MKAHIVGGGFGGLAAAALLIRNAETPGQDITIYEADKELGGGLFLYGSAQSGYNLPGSVFDKEFRCTFDLLSTIPSTKDPAVSVRDEFFAFNDRDPFDDRGHIVDRNGQVVPHGARFGLSLHDFFDLSKILLTPETLLEGRRIEEYFTEEFFSTEFWLLWSTIMGSLPQHSAIEFRRYMNRFLYLFPHLSDMKHILRTPFCQRQAFIDPLAAWLRARGVNFLTGAYVTDLGFAPSPDRLTVDRLDFEREGVASSVAVSTEDIVLVTTGSQAADLSEGTMNEPPPPKGGGRSVALWRRLAEGRVGFGDPDVYFDPAKAADSRWVTFTVTTTGTEFVDRLTALTGSAPGAGGLVTLRDSSWVLSLTIFHNPEVIGQPEGTTILWGYGLYPDRVGDYIRKPMTECTGAEILEEAVRHLKFEGQLGAIMKSSISIPCHLPYVNNIWLPRKQGDRPSPVPPGATNLGLIGQYVETPHEIAFTVECSARTAWEAIRALTQRGPEPPPVYQAEYDPKALLEALKVLLGW
jgi:oleate hydratase